MRGGPGRRDVVERPALVKERRLRRVQVLRGDVLLQRAAAEGHDAPAQIGNGKHDAIAEAVVRHGNLVAGDEQPRFDHVRHRYALPAEMLLQREPLGRRVADAKLELRRRIETAIGEIAARLGAGTRGEARLEELRRKLHHLVERLALRVARLVLARDLRQRHAGELRHALNRLGERDALGLHQEVEDVAVLAGGEVEPHHLRVIHEKGRSLLLVERRQALHLPPRADKLHPAPDNLRDGDAGAQFVEELGREAHGCLRAAALVLGLAGRGESVPLS